MSLDKFIVVLKGGPPDHKDGTNGPGSGHYEHKKTAIQTPVIKYGDLDAKAVVAIEANLKKHNVNPTQIEINIADTWNRAKQKPDFQSWLDWYPQAHQFAQGLADKYKLPVENTIGVIASISPQTAWDKNQRDADKILETLAANPTVKITEWGARQIKAADALKRKKKDGDEPAAAASDKKKKTPKHQPLDLKHYNGIDSKFTGQNLIGTHKLMDLPADAIANLAADLPRDHGMANLTKSIRLAKGESADSILGGPKVRSFYNNILDPNDPDFTTIDSHAIRMMIGFDHTDDETSNVLYKPGSGKLKGAGGYPYFVDKLKTMADRYGVTVNKLQAATWMEFREEHPREARKKFTVQRHAKEAAARAKGNE